MGFRNKYHVDVDFEVPKKLNWYYAPAFIAFWVVLYMGVWLQMQKLPKGLDRRSERHQPDAFIGERAELINMNLARIGPRVVGSVANEITTVEFLKKQVQEVENQSSDYFDIEIDVQVATGAYMHWTMVNMYQAIQNVVVKLSAKNGTSDNFLLINSHFDSVPTSPGAGDDGTMVAVMLEVMRVIAKSPGPLEHPIVFLFNGAEENPLQGSHAFITQHKWAKQCKALLNLDSAGGGREMLFQSGPNHPWLMKYYRQVPHPFATTIGEEIFQAGFIPSDTDFRIFRDYGGVPGLDMAYVFNGYVYHTEYDRSNVVRRASLQHAGDNVLALAKAIANAPEMYNTTLYAEGHVIFYDFLGWFMVFYTETTAIIINTVVAVAALVAIGVSLYYMSARSGLPMLAILRRYGIAVAIEIIAVALGAGITLLVAVFMDGVGRSMTWFSQTWLLMGLYYCPMFFGMAILPALYSEYCKKDTLSLGFRIQLFMHANCVIFIIIMIALMACNIRSAYIFVIGIFFDVAALIINLLTKFHRKAYWFAVTAIICHVLPFFFYTSITQSFYMILIPMSGRSGPGANPELRMAVLTIFTSVLVGGFILPLFLFFRKTRTIICCFAGIMLICIIIAVTPAGFPYTTETATQRYVLLHGNRVLRNADDSIRVNDTGVYFNTQDRRGVNSADEYMKILGEKHDTHEYCEQEMFCGFPLYNHRWQSSRDQGYWIPMDEYAILPVKTTELSLENIFTLEESANRQRFNFELTGPDHMTIYIGVKNEATIIDWSFNDTLLKTNEPPPYFIYYSYGLDNSALKFHIDVEKTTGDFKTPSLEIGIGGYWIHQQKIYTPKFAQFLDSLPPYSSVTDFVASYDTWLY